MDFHGVKVALLHEDRLLMHLRDRTPGLFNANRWDFPGGGREGEETPHECAVREVQEELGIILTEQSFIWEKEYPAQKDPTQKAWFMVAHITHEEVNSVVLTEGQKWDLIPVADFFQRPDVIDALKSRFRNYMDAQ